jgi:hypothetical protein
LHFAITHVSQHGEGFSMISILRAVIGAVMFLIFGLGATVRADGLPETFQLVPLPQKVSLTDGKPLEAGRLRRLRLEGGAARPVLRGELDGLPLAGADSGPSLTLTIGQSPELPESDEGYALTVSAEGTRVEARGAAGLFYGAQTLAQLLEDAHDTATPIPACHIVDWPALRWRAVHLDVVHHLNSIKYYYDLIDRLAAFKINGFVFELEDKLRYRRRPLIGAANAITIDEMQMLTRYARERHIDLSPLSQGLGHASYILKHPEMQHLREIPKSDWAFCPLNEETYQVQFDLYSDVIEATPGSRFLHVGGDEVNEFGELGSCPRCKASGKKPLELQLIWLNRVCEFAEKNGRIPIFWDDMLLKHANVIQTTSSRFDREKTAEVWRKNRGRLDALKEKFPANCWYMRWSYGNLDNEGGDAAAFDWYKESGLTAVGASAAQCTSPLMPRGDRIPCLVSFCHLCCQRGIEGLLCCSWDDSSPHTETYWRGWIAHAAYSWAGDRCSLEEYNAAYRQREFGPQVRPAAMAFEEELAAAIGFWDRAFFKDNRRGILTREGPRPPLVDLPEGQNSGVWSKTNAERISQAREEVKRSQTIAERIAQASANARRNRYALELFAALNDVQATSAKTLVALADYDATAAEKRTVEHDQSHTRSNLQDLIAATADKHQSALDRVNGAIAEYKRAKARFMAVFSVTRFPANPPGYQLDQSNHTADISNDSAAWMFLIEDDFHARLANWVAAQER